VNHPSFSETEELAIKRSISSQGEVFISRFLFLLLS
jgi:hypothetical protein